MGEAELTIEERLFTMEQTIIALSAVFDIGLCKVIGAQRYHFRDAALAMAEEAISGDKYPAKRARAEYAARLLIGRPPPA